MFLFKLNKAIEDKEVKRTLVKNFVLIYVKE